MAITEQKQIELAERNANIVKRFCEKSEQQPLAIASRIIAVVANEFSLTPQSVGRILRENNIKTTTPALNEIEL